jgi:ACT domain
MHSVSQLLFSTLESSRPPLSICCFTCSIHESPHRNSSPLPSSISLRRQRHCTPSLLRLQTPIPFAILPSVDTNMQASFRGVRASSSTSAIAYKASHRRRPPPLPTIDPPSWSAAEAVTNILYNTPDPPRTPPKRHVLNCLVQDEPGVLARVSGVLAARGFNIDSLIVCNTEVPSASTPVLGGIPLWFCLCLVLVVGANGVVGWRFVEDEYCVEGSRWCC